MSDLTSDVLKDFADIVIDTDNSDGETTVYGTTVESDGVDYVKIDGSSLLTPIVTTTDIKPGERVLVMIKNHQAIIIGNSSNPSAGKDQVNQIQNEVVADQARIDTIVANEVVINESLNAHAARIDDLVATNVVIEGKLTADRADIDRIDANKIDADEADIRYAKVDDLTATNADIVNLNADYAKFKDASVKRLDANEASIKDLDAKKLSAEDADIKYLTIENAQATYLKAGDFNAYKATVETLLATKASVEELEANYLKATQAEATYAKITELDALTGNFNTLNADLAKVEELVAKKASIEDLNAANAAITTLQTDLTTANQLIAKKVDADYVDAEIVKATKTITDDLTAIHAVVDVLDTKYATIEQLNAAKANLETLIAKKATIEDLNAANANISNLDALVANINTILSGSIGTGTLQTIHLTASNVVIDDAIIKSANIEGLDVSKLNAGTISTDKFVIQSDDGGVLISGSTQQFKDKNGRVRLQIGKDAQGDFNFIVFGEDGTTAIYNQNGITKNAVPDGLIVDKMVADDAGIQAKKVQYTDKDGNKTLQTVIETEQGRIDTLIKETTIDNGDGTTTKLKDAYNQTKSTVEGNTTTIANIQTSVNTLTGDVDSMDSRITEVETTADGLKTTVSKATSDASSALTIANQNASKFSWIVKSGSSATDFTLTDRTASLVADYINLNGLVTFSALDSDTQTVINTSKDTLEAWNSEDIQENITTINGGYIRTNSITSIQLNTDEIYSNSAFIGAVQTTNLNADMITAGTIKSNLLSLYGFKMLNKVTNQESLSITDTGDITMRGSIESYNYHAGKTGWAINSSNDDAEFNNVTVRGSVITNDGGIVSAGGSGRNLQLNTSFYNNLYDWSRGSNYSVDTEFQYKGTNSVKFTRTGLTADSVQYLYSGSNKIPCTVGKSYTAQANFYTKDSSAIDGDMGVVFGIYFYTSDNTSAGTFRKKVSFVNNQWVYETVTAVAPENAAYVAIATGAYRNGTFWEALPKLEEGSVATDYSLAPEDKIKQVRFWAGATYDERESAPFVVYNDGYIKATQGEFGGVFTGQVKIGNISIVDPSETSGGDALLTIQNGQNGIKKIQLRDTDSSSFAQNLVITNNVYDNTIELNQNGYGTFKGGLNINSKIILEGSHMTINGYELTTNTNGFLFNAPQVDIGNSNNTAIMDIYGLANVNGNLKVTKKINYNDIVETTIGSNGIDFDVIV